MDEVKRINCFRCIYLKITWQPNFPYACEAVGFKSKMLPSMEIHRNSGVPCQLFVQKPNMDEDDNGNKPLNGRRGR